MTFKVDGFLTKKRIIHSIYYNIELLHFAYIKSRSDFLSIRTTKSQLEPQNSTGHFYFHQRKIE